MRNSRTASRALSVIALSIVGVVLVAGISQGDSKPLTKQKAKKLFFTKAQADERFLNVGEVEEVTVGGWHEVGAPGEPVFGPGPGGSNCGGDFPCWKNFGSVHNSVGFYKDPDGVVHLKGIADCQFTAECAPAPSHEGIIFILPAGSRPAAQEAFSVLSSVAPGVARVDVTAGGVVVLRSPGIPDDGWVSLDGITFRAA